MDQKFQGARDKELVSLEHYIKTQTLLFFDEAFSSLDVLTKNTILKQIKELSKLKTIISISHSPEDLNDCDKIINLNDLKI